MDSTATGVVLFRRNPARMDIIQPAKCTSTYQVVLSLSVFMALHLPDSKFLKVKNSALFIFIYSA